jgi:hypothetical protein
MPTPLGGGLIPRPAQKSTGTSRGGRGASRGGGRGEHGDGEVIHLHIQRWPNENNHKGQRKTKPTAPPSPSPAHQQAPVKPMALLTRAFPHGQNSAASKVGTETPKLQHQRAASPNTTAAVSWARQAAYFGVTAIVRKLNCRLLLLIFSYSI